MKQHFIQQMPWQLLCALGRANLRIPADFFFFFKVLYLQHLQFFLKNGSWKIPELAHSSNTAVFPLTSGRCLRENASPSIPVCTSQVCAPGSCKPYSQHIQSSLQQLHSLSDSSGSLTLSFLFIFPSTFWRFLIFKCLVLAIQTTEHLITFKYNNAANIH